MNSQSDACDPHPVPNTLRSEAGDAQGCDCRREGRSAGEPALDDAIDVDVGVRRNGAAHILAAQVHTSASCTQCEGTDESDALEDELALAWPRAQHRERPGLRELRVRQPGTLWTHPVAFLVEMVSVA